MYTSCANRVDSKHSGMHLAKNFFCWYLVNRIKLNWTYLVTAKVTKANLPLCWLPYFSKYLRFHRGSRNSLLVRAPDFRSKGCKFESRQRRRGNFLLQSQLCVLSHFWCPFLPHVTTVANKRPRSFCQKWGWHITPKHTYTLDPTKSEWADYAAVQA